MRAELNATRPKGKRKASIKEVFSISQFFAQGGAWIIKQTLTHFAALSTVLMFNL